MTFEFKESDKRANRSDDLWFARRVFDAVSRKQVIAHWTGLTKRREDVVFDHLLQCFVNQNLSDAVIYDDVTTQVSNDGPFDLRQRLFLETPCPSLQNT